MYLVPLPVDDWTLLLTPRFGTLGPVWQIAFLAVLAIVPISLLLWLYRYELRLLRMLPALVLLGGRLAAVAVIWFIVAFQPVLARNTIERLPSRIIVAIDQSMSMDVPDPQRTPAEKLKLARALGMVPNTATTLVNRWIKDHTEKADSQPQWLLPQEIALPPEQQRALEQGRRRLHQDLLQKMDKLTRRDILARLLLSDGRDVLNRLAKEHDVQVIGFDDAAREIPLDQLPAIFLDREGEAARTSRGTNLSRPLEWVTQQGTPGESKCLGVLLFSDGRHNEGDNPVQRAQQLSQVGVPLFPVKVAGPGSPPDLRVEFVKGPTNVFKNSEARIEARIQVSGIAAQPLVVELRQDGKVQIPEDHRKTVQHDGSDRSYLVHFPVKMEEAGMHRLEFQVQPSLPNTIELSLDNNRKDVAVRVAPDQARVLIVDAEARWENYYLVSALKRDKTLRVDSVVFEQPRIGMLDEAALREAGFASERLPAAPAEPTEADPFFDYECIILGDVSPENLPLADRKRLESFVADHGGTLVVLAGKRWMPHGFPANTDADQADPLHKLLPVEEVHAAPSKTGFHITLTEDGLSSPLMRLDNDADGGIDRWQKSLPHYWSAVGKAKPGAVTLGYLRALQGEASKDDGARQRALIAMHAYGFGNVLYIGIDSTWRLRYRTGDLYHHRFWAQVVRWASASRLLPAGNKYVRYGTRKAVYDAGEEVEIRVRLEPEANLSNQQAQGRVKLMRQLPDGAEEVQSEVKLTPIGQPSRQLHGIVRDLPAGTYRMELDIPELGKKLLEPAEKGTDAAKGNDTFSVLAAESKEMLELAGNESLLQSIALSSGGRVIALDELDDLIESWQRQVITREEHSELAPWRDQPVVWYLLGVLLVLLTTEWIIRKMVNLP